jgi:redox-sensitive bicupin YhaK (pirin superfamily)
LTLTACGDRAASPTLAERAIYVAKGAVEVEGRRVETGRMVVFGADDRPTITALEPSTVACLGGEPIGEPIVWWNLVSHSRDRIEQAKADWARGDWSRFTLPPDDNAEFIPLPDLPRPPERMS